MMTHNGQKKIHVNGQDKFIQMGREKTFKWLGNWHGDEPLILVYIWDNNY